MSKDTGGPAFPAEKFAVHFGMTLRDYFAAKALQGMLARPHEWPSADAKSAYKYADAMLEARKND